jgi:hypothetical protein
MDCCKIAKNKSTDAIPKNLTQNGQPVIDYEAVNIFAANFYDKVAQIKSNCCLQF